LLEASQRQYWKPDAAMLEALQRAGEELEDRLEGVFESQNENAPQPHLQPQLQRAVA
jgi:magnesium chelatase subunit H